MSKTSDELYQDYLDVAYDTADDAYDDAADDAWELYQDKLKEEKT